MAVEAPNINLFPPQFISNGDFICNAPMNEAVSQFLPATINKADSGLTCNINTNIPVVSASRKRPRDASFVNCFDSYNSVPRKNKSILEDDIVINQIQQQQQQEIDRFIAQHTEKVRLEVEERRKRQTRVLINAIQEGVMKKLKEKDEEIQRMVKINWVLQERVKSMYIENQLWRDLAQTNEATANSLRTNLKQVLAHVGEDRQPVDDAESSCGSSDEGWRKVVVSPLYAAVETAEKVVGDGGVRKCRKCGEKEASVLLLPCRHLCLCTMCGSSMVGTCPVCESVTNASVHLNMS